MSKLSDKFKNFEKPQPIKPQDLKPPKTVSKPPIKKVMRAQEDFFMDFNYLINNSSFQRGITEWIKHTFTAFKGINHRASKSVMNQQIQVRNTEINEALTIVNQMPTPLLNEMRNKSELYKKQKAKHNN